MSAATLFTDYAKKKNNNKTHDTAKATTKNYEKKTMPSDCLRDFAIQSSNKFICHM